MGFLTWDNIKLIYKKLEVIEKHLADLNIKTDAIIKENNSIKDQIFKLKK